MELTSTVVALLVAGAILVLGLVLRGFAGSNITKSSKAGKSGEKSRPLKSAFVDKKKRPSQQQQPKKGAKVNQAVESSDDFVPTTHAYDDDDDKNVLEFLSGKTAPADAKASSVKPEGSSNKKVAKTEVGAKSVGKTEAVVKAEVKKHVLAGSGSAEDSGEDYVTIKRHKTAPSTADGEKAKKQPEVEGQKASDPTKKKKKKPFFKGSPADEAAAAAAAAAAPAPGSDGTTAATGGNKTRFQGPRQGFGRGAPGVGTSGAVAGEGAEGGNPTLEPKKEVKPVIIKASQPPVIDSQYNAANIDDMLSSITTFFGSQPANARPHVKAGK